MASANQTILLAQDHKVFCVASEISLLFLENTKHLFESEPFYKLLLQSLDALKNGDPMVIKIKTLFVFAEKEGLPVRQAWLPELKVPLRNHAKSILSNPVADFKETPESAGEILLSLANWLNAETEIKCRT